LIHASLSAILFVVFVVPLCVSLIVSSNYLALPSKRAFVAASRPKGKGRKLTMKIQPVDGKGKSRAVRLWFRNRTEALYFQSRFGQ
jgi:Na+-transporting NADH:ubiquinone oxidoreductase subunit NqrC